LSFRDRDASHIKGGSVPQTSPSSGDISWRACYFNSLDSRDRLGDYHYRNIVPQHITFTMAIPLPKPDREAGKTWPAIAIGFFVAFGGVLFG
jgi:hypothetical protein